VKVLKEALAVNPFLWKKAYSWCGITCW